MSVTPTPHLQNVQNVQVVHEDPAILNITFTDSAGKTLGSPIMVRVPRMLSKRLAKMCIGEIMGKLTKATLDKVVADLGW